MIHVPNMTPKRWLAAGLGVVLLLGVAFAVWLGLNPSHPGKVSPPAAASAPPSPVAAAKPVRIKIPSLGVDAAVIELGVQESGELEVPKDYAQTGWYKYGAKPGEKGGAVIAGHLDSPTGPAAFFKLKQLRAGERIEVVGDNGQTVSFAVTSTESFPQKQFPTQKVYGQTDLSELRLITCDGLFNDRAQRYADNLIVFAAKQ